MEAFSLLKYWRGGGGGGGSGDSVVNARATTIVAAAVAQNNAAETETDDDEANGDDDGPFFDLEFAVPDEEEEEEEEEQKKGMGVGVGEEEEEEDDEDGESTSCDHDEEEEQEEDEEAEGGNGDGDCTDEAREFKFTLSSSGSSSNNDRADPSLALSPTDDLFFKGRLVPIEPSEPNSKQIQFPVSLIKSATKFRVFMLGLKKSKPNPADKPADGAEATANGSASCVSAAEAVVGAGATPKKEDQSNTKQGKFFTVKFKIEEVKPIVSLFTRENSKSSSNKSTQAQTQKQNGSGNEESAAAAAASDEKRFSRDVMQKYLKKVKPLYIRVSKRYGEKLRFSGQLSLASVTSTATLKGSSIKEKGQQESETESVQGSTATFLGTNGKSLKQGSLPAGLRVVRKHLAKSRSASAAVAAAPSSSSSSSSGRRRDDSLLQQQDGIQSAILHCKRSFNASRDSEASLLSRSVSDPSHEKM